MSCERWTTELRGWLEVAARQAGFDIAGVADVPVRADPAAVRDAARFGDWVESGYAGEMEYLKRGNEAGELLRGNLQTAMPWARSVVVCAMNYNASAPRSVDAASPGAGWIARYAWSGRTREDGAEVPTDYHNELLARLRTIEAGLLARTASTTRCYVDTGPLVERRFAAAAGIGWIGKNTCVLNQQLGSWLLLGVIVTSLPVEELEGNEEGRSCAECAEKYFPGAEARIDFSPPMPGLKSRPISETAFSASSPAVRDTIHSGIFAPDRCGSCTRCIDACPTGALLGAKSPEAPRTMDASRCISYLTIEKKGAIAEDLRGPMGRQVFGCDICQEVCPWNRRAPAADNEGMRPRAELINPALEWLAEVDAREFKRRFRGSPLERTGRKRLLRNVAIAMGNSGDSRYVSQLKAWSESDDPVLREAAEWALGRFLSGE